MKIEGFFSNYKNANEAVKALNETGIKNAYVDLNEEDAADMNVRTNIPGTETGQSLSNLVLGSGSNVVRDESKAPSSAANPMVSGMAGFEEVADVNYKVIVNVEENLQKKAKDIIQKNGGDFINPHVKEPEIDTSTDRVFSIAAEQLRQNLEQ